MAPILFCKCSQCICTATVLINSKKDSDRETKENFRNSDDKYNIIPRSLTTKVFTSSDDKVETHEPVTSVIDPIDPGDSKASLEFLFFTILIIFIVICK